jgi:CNT family concentrative nucleoside transporter
LTAGSGQRRNGGLAKASWLRRAFQEYRVTLKKLWKSVVLGMMATLLGLGFIGAASIFANGEPAGLAHAQEGTAAAAAEQVVSILDVDTTMLERLWCTGGVVILLAMSYAMSNNRQAINWRLVMIGTGIQWVFAAFILKTPFGEPIFATATAVFSRLLQFTQAGATLLFGYRDPGLFLSTFAFGVLPTIIFFSSLMAILYYLGVMQRIVLAMAWLMQRSMGTSGSETLSAAANIFVGQTEAPLMIKPYIEKMTSSELMAVMTGGFATVAGGVMAMYIQMLSPAFPDIAGHLLAASVMSAPAGLVVAKMMYPETEESATRAGVRMDVESIDANLIDAAARGASEGLTLALNVAAMLLAFVSLIALVNFVVAYPSYVQHGSALTQYLGAIEAAGRTLPADLAATCTGAGVEASQSCVTQLAAAFPDLQAPSMWMVVSLERIFGWVFAPLALAMGVPWNDCVLVGELLGTKTVVNEWLAYDRLSEMVRDPSHPMHPRSVVIASYALCGFANFGSIAIQLGGIGGIAPSRRGDLARLGMRAMIAGSIASFITASIAGALI